MIERPGKELWAIEIKSAQRIDETELNRKLQLAKDLKVKRFLVASREEKKRKHDMIEIMNWEQALIEIFGKD